MELTNIKLNNFRNYEKLDLKFSKNYNIFYGNNGSGKTNLVEAIYLLALTKSFRVNDDKLMIKLGENGLLVEGKVKTKVNTRYKISIDKEGNKITTIDNGKSSLISDYISNINVILFNPEDVNLINNTPTERRKLLNIEISKMNKEYLLLLNTYNKILKHRNSYLKDASARKNLSIEYLDVLTSKLIEMGLKIRNYRETFIKDINNYISNIYKDIFGYGELKVTYVSEFLNKDAVKISENFAKNYKKELQFGKTLLGVHHDDIVFILDGVKLKDFGSVGQHKNSIIAFKLAEIEMIKKEKNENPILILDDLFSEIDSEKARNIIKILDNNIQVFITTTSIDNVVGLDIKKSKSFKVTKGKIEEERNGK